MPSWPSVVSHRHRRLSRRRSDPRRSGLGTFPAGRTFSTEVLECGRQAVLQHTPDGNQKFSGVYNAANGSDGVVGPPCHEPEPAAAGFRCLSIRDETYGPRRCRRRMPRLNEGASGGARDQATRRANRWSAIPVWRPPYVVTAIRRDRRLCARGHAAGRTLVEMSDIRELRDAAVATLEAAIDQVLKAASTSDLVAALKEAEIAVGVNREALIERADVPGLFWDVDVLE